MSKKAAGGKKSGGPGPRGKQGETWYCAVAALPAYVEGDPPFRPTLVVVVDQKGLIVGHGVLGPDVSEESIGDIVRGAIDRPLFGAPRTPETLVVEDDLLAASLAGSLGDVRVVGGDIGPAIEVVQGMMAAAMSSSEEDADAASVEPSYFESGRITAEELALFFEQCARVWRTAPWASLGDDEVILVDIPSLGVEGACLSVIGGLGESFGLILFESAEAFEVFRDLGQDLDEDDDEPELPEIGSEILSINFERGADLPEPMRQEVLKNGWTVASAEAYPHVLCFDESGVPRPFGSKEIRIATAIAEAMAWLFEEHGEALGDEEEPEIEVGIETRSAPLRKGDAEGAEAGGGASWARGPGVEVHLVVPHPEVDWGAPEDDEDDEDDDWGDAPKLVYDANQAPDPEVWLETGEHERVHAVTAHHATLTQEEHAPVNDAHHMFHLIVENQLAAGDPPEAGRALVRLLDEGLTRHQCIHALGTVVAKAMFEVTQKQSPLDLATLAADFDALDRARWEALSEPDDPSPTRRTKEKASRRPKSGGAAAKKASAKKKSAPKKKVKPGKKKGR